MSLRSRNSQMSIASDPESSPFHYGKPESRGEPLDVPPTPKSFGGTPRLNETSDTASDAGSDEAESSTASVPIGTVSALAPDELPVADSPIITHFDHRNSRIEPSPIAIETDVPFTALPPIRSPPTTAYRPGSGSILRESRPVTSGSVASFTSAAAVAVAVDPSAPAFRYSSIRSRDGKSAASSLRSKSRGSVASPSLSPVQPEVAAMLEQVNQHRQDVAALAESTGILGDKYFEGLRGYTSIQEPTNAFWKRRYF
ncbi:hypothetical protein FBU31_007051, partial [Coemansia sp. 'formosensis']